MIRYVSQVKSKLKIFLKKMINSVQESTKSPLSWSNILWDPYLEDDMPEKSMRFAKILIALLFVFKILNLVYVGICLAIDGLYSLYRYRFELNITKSWSEDLPKIARIMLGLMLISYSLI
ncbi:MAG: hypothetical protein NZ893_01090 [Candidatus Aenigmarchaeota archaeon]|nr:hypothetical protein [Candidatus Aenigmarchaeota archaeon]